MMDRRDLSALAKSLGVVVREYVTAAMGTLWTQIEDRLKQIPAGKDGVDGKDADPELVRAAIALEVANAVRALPTPKDGVDGKDAPPLDMAVVIAEVVRQIPVPKDGLDGKDGAPGRDADILDVPLLVSLVEGKIPPPKDGAPGKDGKDGKDGEPGLTVIGERGEKGLDGKDGRDGREGKDGRDGAPGRDALEIDVLPTIDESKSYPRGTFASFRNGFLRARLNTSPIGEGSLEECGWDVIVNGWAPPQFEPGDDPREFTILWNRTNGAPTVFKAYIPVPLYRDIWRDTETYRKGDTVTRDGSLWHCNTDQTKVPPGTPNAKDWTLCVKHGRDGKPGLNGKDGERGKDGPPGRDLTQVDFHGNKH